MLRRILFACSTGRCFTHFRIICEDFRSLLSFGLTRIRTLASDLQQVGRLAENTLSSESTLMCGTVR